MSILRVIVNLFQFNKTNWKAVSLCVAAAVIFWLFNALNKDYQTNLRFPIDFSFDKSRYIPVKPLPENVFMNVSGNGWDLLRKSLGFKLPPMVLSLDRPAEVKKVVGSTLPALLAGQLGSLQINYVVTDTLYVDIDPIDKHKFKLVVDASAVTFHDGFGRLSPIVVLPDSVVLEGPRKLLHEMPDSIVIKIPGDGLNHNYREEVEIHTPNAALLKRNPPVVEVIFEVGEFTEIRRSLPLQVANVRGRKRITLVRDSVQCFLRLPKNQLADFQSESAGYFAQVDAQSLQKGEQKIKPRVLGMPSYVEVLGVDSVTLKLY